MSSYLRTNSSTVNNQPISFYSTFQEEVSHIARSLKNSWNINRVVVKKEEEGTFFCKAVLNWRQLLPDFLNPFFNANYLKENRETIDYFYQIFGRRRVEQISNENHLRIEYKRIHGIALTRKDVELLFLYMGIVKIETLQNIFETIKERPENYLNLTGESLETLYQLFHEKEFSDLTRGDFDLLYEIASPFERIETYFLNHLPDIKNVYTERWGDEEGRKKMVYTIEDIRRNCDRNDLEKAQRECDFRKIKRHVSFCMKNGLVLPEPKGYRFVYKKLEGGGCYKIFLKALTKAHDFRSQVCYLPTQAWDGAVDSPWESIMEDFKPEIGSLGVRVTYEDTKSMLNNSRLGFVETEREKVDSLGYSLGGTMAQRDFCLFANKYATLTVVNNPGLESSTTREFARRINGLSAPQQRPKITFLWDSDDSIPYIGEEFLGIGCDANKIEVEARLMHPVENENEICPQIPQRIQAPESNWEAFRKVRNSFFKVHGRETTISSYRQNVLNNQNEQARQRLNQEILTNIPYGWEERRKKISHFLFGRRGEGDFLRFYRDQVSQ